MRVLSAILVKPATFFRPLVTVRMSDLAAGKKAAAIRAIDDYVKVRVKVVIG